MFDVDWLGENEPPKKTKRKRRTKAELRAAGYYAKPRAGKRALAKEKGVYKVGRPKGSGRNSPESIVKASQSRKSSSWRSHAPNKGSAPMQSSSGFADCVVSVHGDGRVMPKHIKEDWDG